MANSFRSDALNLIGSYSDGCDSDSSEGNESVSPAVEISEPSTLNTTSISAEEPDKQQSDKAFDSHVVIMQDEVPHVGMDYTIDCDPPDESTCAQIQLIESQVDCGGNDTTASDQPTHEKQLAEKASVKSDYSASESHDPNVSDHTVEPSVEMMSDLINVQLEAREHQEPLNEDIQKTLTPKEEKSCNEDKQSPTTTSTVEESSLHSSEYVSTPEAQPKTEPESLLNNSEPASDSTLYVGSDSHQQLSREESSQHHGYYGDEHGYDQQYYDHEQQYEYQQYYDHHQYNVPKGGEEQYDSNAENQQEVQETGKSTQDAQQWHVQSDHQQHMHLDRHQHPQCDEQQLHLMSDQIQYTNQPEYSMSECHHLQPEQQQYSQPESEQQQHYPQPEQQQQYPQPEQQQQYPQPEQVPYSQPEQHQYLHPEQQQQYAQPEPEQLQQYHGPHPEQQQQYSQPEQLQQYTQPEQQQLQQYHGPHPEQQQQYSQPEQLQQYHGPHPEQQQQYSQFEQQQQYPQPDQQQQYPQPEQQQQHQQQYYGPHTGQQQEYSQSEQQQQYPQPEQQQQQQQQYSQTEQQHQYSQSEQYHQYPQLEQQQQYYGPHPGQQQQYSQSEQHHQYPQPEQHQQYSQHEPQQYPHTDQQYYTQDYTAHRFLEQPDQQQQSYTPPQQQEPDSQLQCTEDSVAHHLQPDQQQHGEPQGEYSHGPYAQQQQYSDPHHNRIHGQYSPSYEHQHYAESKLYGRGSYHRSHDRTHEQSTRYSYPNKEEHDASFGYRQTAEHAVDRSEEPDYQPYPSHHHSGPHLQPLPHFDYNHQEQGGRGSDQERLNPRHGDWGDRRPYHRKWGDNCYSTGEQQSNRLPSHPVYGSPGSDTWRDPTHSPVKRNGAGHLSDPRLDSDVRNSPQRNYKTSGELSDPRKKQRGTKERGTEGEERHYTKSAKYTKISSTVVSRRPAMLKASYVSKASRVKSSGPQIIEPHFASTSPPKTKVCDKGDKSKPPGKLPEATTAKKALANFKIPKHKSSKMSSELTTFKPAVKIPALDIPEKSKEEDNAEDLPCNAAKIDTSKKKDTADCQSKSVVKPAQGKQAKAAKLPTKVLPSNAPTMVLSNLDATTLQALTTIVHQTLRMAANKGMPVAKSITGEMSQLSEMTTSSHSGEVNVTTITPTTAIMAASPSLTTTAVPSTATASSSTSITVASTTEQVISSASQVLDLQNAPAPTVSVVPATTAQDPLASSPVSASSPTPLQTVPLAAPKVEQAAGISNQQQISKGTEGSDSAVSVAMVYVPKTETTSTSASVTKLLPRKTSGVVLATILSGASSQIKGKSTRVPTAGISNPSKVLVPHTVSSCPPLPSVKATAQISASTDTSQPTSVANSVMVEKTTLSMSNEADNSSEQSVKKTGIDAQAESRKANITQKSPPGLEYFNADLMFKEYNLRQSAASRDGSPLKRLQENIGNHDSSCESKPSKRERSPQSDALPIHKKVKRDVIRTQENEDAPICNRDRQPQSSENLTKNAMHNTKGRSKPSLRRKASAQRRKSRLHQRPQLHGTEAATSEEHTHEDLLCAFCHQRGGAMNLGFLYGPYKFDPVSVTNDDQINTNKDAKESTGDHQRELWVHEDCAVWAPGVCLVGDQLIGLHEAVADGDKMMCEACGRSGATLCCTAHGCKTAFHYPCAQETGCALKEEQFLICCSKHRGTMQS